MKNVHNMVRGTFRKLYRGDGWAGKASSNHPGYTFWIQWLTIEFASSHVVVVSTTYFPH